MSLDIPLNFPLDIIFPHSLNNFIYEGDERGKRHIRDRIGSGLYNINLI